MGKSTDNQNLNQKFHFPTYTTLLSEAIALLKQLSNSQPCRRKQNITVEKDKTRNYRKKNLTF